MAGASEVMDVWPYSIGANRPRSGSGLGLYIAKSIVTRHGGRLWATSEVGKGSTFHFTLPRLN